MYQIIAWVFRFEKSKFSGKPSKINCFRNVDNVDKYWKKFFDKGNSSIFHLCKIKKIHTENVNKITLTMWIMWIT